MEDVSGVGNWQEVGGEMESQAGLKNGAGGDSFNLSSLGEHMLELADSCWKVLRAGTCSDSLFCRIPLAALGKMSLGGVILEAVR